MSWTKENWFKLVISFGVLCVIFMVGLYLYQQNKSNQSLKDLEIKQQEELSEKEKRIQELELQTKDQYDNSEVKDSQKPLENTTPKQISTDSAIKIEKCKTVAKKFADGKAKRDYLQAFEKAQAQGDTESATFYLQASFEPKHPADYDSNYQSSYIQCLDI